MWRGHTSCLVLLERGSQQSVSGRPMGVASSTELIWGSLEFLGHLWVNTILMRSLAGLVSVMCVRAGNHAFDSTYRFDSTDSMLNMWIRSSVSSVLKGLQVRETDTKPSPGCCRCDTRWGLWMRQGWWVAQASRTVERFSVEGYDSGGTYSQSQVHDTLQSESIECEEAGRPGMEFLHEAQPGKRPELGG